MKLKGRYIPHVNCIVIAWYQFGLKIYSILFNFSLSYATRSILIHQPWGFCLRVEWWNGHHNHPSGHGAVRREWLASTDEFCQVSRQIARRSRCGTSLANSDLCHPQGWGGKHRVMGWYHVFQWQIATMKRCMQCRGLQVFGPYPRKLFAWSIHWSINTFQHWTDDFFAAMNLASAVHAETEMIASQLLRLGQTAEGNFLELVGAPSDFKDPSSGQVNT